MDKSDGSDKEYGLVTNNTNGLKEGIVVEEEGFWTRVGITPDAFKRRNQNDAKGELNHKMKPRHLTMIAMGGGIGAGFWVASGSALNNGGPAALLIDFALLGFMIFNVVYALGEMAVLFPVTGGFYAYASRFIDPSWGFAMGWNYVFQWATVLPLELVVAGLTMQYWESIKGINVGIWIVVFLSAIVVVNIFGALGYAEEEFFATSLKLTAVIIFMFTALIMVLGGGPSRGKFDEYWGARLWHDPGAIKNGFKGVCSVFVTAAFAFAGTELVGLAANESASPATALPRAVKQIFWRIVLFYITGLLLMGLLVSSNDPRLLGSGGLHRAASPFVLAVKDAGLVGLDSFLNTVILFSVISIGNSGIYGGSRTMHALATEGYGPKFLTYIDRAGRPLPATIIMLCCGLLGFINLTASGQVIFSWLVSLGGLAALFTWGSICVAHIRFRAAWKQQGHNIDEIPFQALFGVYGSWISLILIILVFIAQFYTALFPISENGKLGSVSDFFQSMLAVPVVLVFWAGGFVWKKTKWLKLEDIDIDTGRREPDWVAIRERKEKIANSPAWKRVFYFLF